MPGMDGYETCRRLKAHPETADIPVIFISALNETEDKLTAFSAGAADYVSKPFQAAEVLGRVRAQLQLYRMQQHLETMVHERTDELRATCESLESSRAQYQRLLEQTIQAIALTIEKRDAQSAGHQIRVSQLATAIAQKMNLDADRLDGLRFVGMIHDIGKIHLAGEILSRPGPLSADEFALVKTHPAVGAEIFAEVGFPWPVAEMILQHHERLDGSGYPNGLRQDAILLEARILAVADVVEAMASHCAYRPAIDVAKVLEEIGQERGRLYDSDAVDACVHLFNEEGYRLPPAAGTGTGTGTGTGKLR
jgi:putative two-component system response regulator